MTENVEKRCSAQENPVSGRAEEVRKMRRRVVLMGVLLLSVGLLAGCPKRPEVAQAGPGAVGPGAATAPTPPTSPGPAPRVGEAPVTRPAPPAETPIRPASPVAPATP